MCAAAVRFVLPALHSVAPPVTAPLHAALRHGTTPSCTPLDAKPNCVAPCGATPRLPPLMPLLNNFSLLEYCTSYLAALSPPLVLSRAVFSAATVATVAGQLSAPPWRDVIRSWVPSWPCASLPSTFGLLIRSIFIAPSAQDPSDVNVLCVARPPCFAI